MPEPASLTLAAFLGRVRVRPGMAAFNQLAHGHMPSTLRAIGPGTRPSSGFADSYNHTGQFAARSFVRRMVPLSMSTNVQQQTVKDSTTQGAETHAGAASLDTGSLTRRVKRFQATILWLLRDGIRHVGGRMAIVAAMDCFGLLSQLAALGLLYVYVNSVAAGRPLPVGRLDLPLADPASMLGFAVVLVFALFAGAALLDHRARVLGYDLGLHYRRFCHRRLLSLAGLLPHPAARMASETLRNHRAARDLFRTPESCGIAMQLLLQSANPLGTVAIVALVLLVRNPLVFAVVAVLSLTMLAFIYPKHLQAAEHGVKSRTLAPLARNSDRRLQSYAMSAPNPAPPEQLAGQADRISDADGYRAAMRARQSAGEGGNLVAGLVVAIVLAAILGLEGATLLSEPTRWGELLLYLVTLRYGLAALRRLVAILNQFNRQYPRLRQYFEFAADAVRAQSPPPAPSGRPPRLRLRALDGTSARLNLGTEGSILALLHPAPLNRFTKMLLYDLERRQGGTAGESRASEYWSVGRLRCTGLTLRQCFGFPPDYSADRLRAEIVRLSGDAPDGEFGPPELDRVITPEPSSRMKKSRSGLLRVIAALHSRAAVILVSSHDMPDIEDVRSAGLGSLLDGRTTIIVYGRLHARIGRFGETALLVSDGRRLLGWAPIKWIETRPEELSRLTGLKARSSKRPADAPDEDPDEDETLEGGG